MKILSLILILCILAFSIISCARAEDKETTNITERSSIKTEASMLPPLPNQSANETSMQKETISIEDVIHPKDTFLQKDGITSIIITSELMRGGEFGASILAEYTSKTGISAINAIVDFFNFLEYKEPNPDPIWMTGGNYNYFYILYDNGICVTLRTTGSMNSRAESFLKVRITENTNPKELIDKQAADWSTCVDIQGKWKEYELDNTNSKILISFLRQFRQSN